MLCCIKKNKTKQQIAKAITGLSVRREQLCPQTHLLPSGAVPEERKTQAERQSQHCASSV